MFSLFRPDLTVDLSPMADGAWPVREAKQHTSGADEGPACGGGGGGATVEPP